MPKNPRGVETRLILENRGYASIEAGVSDLFSKGFTPTAIAQELGFSRQRVYQAMTKLGLPLRGQNKGLPRGARNVNQ